MRKKRSESKSELHRGLLPSCLLLLLAESDGYGYELAERLEAFGFVSDGPGSVYAELRKLQAKRLVESRFGAPAGGPPPRVYQLTPAGSEALHRNAAGLSELMAVLRDYALRYEAVASSRLGS